MPSAWTVIDSETLAAPASSVSFTGISDTYRVFRVTAYIVKDGTGGAVIVRLNNDSGTNYDRQLMLADGTNISASRAVSQTEFDVSGSTVLSANEVGTYEVVIAKQLSATPSMLLARNVHNVTGPSIRAAAVAGRWNNTANLISRIDLISGSGNFAAGTTVVLEGM